MMGLLIGLVSWNALVFLVYGLDKRRAVRKSWRISEKALLVMAICFGGPGALLAGKVFHHKTKKWYFQLTWYSGCIVLIAIIYAMFTIG